MSSHSRNRDYELSRGKEMSDYRSSPYASKSRDVDSRKREPYSSRDVNSSGMGEKHRDHYTKPSRRSIDDHKESFISSERRDSESKRERESYTPGSSREMYNKGERERDYSFEPREKGYSSRGGRLHASVSSRGHREPYSSRGSREPFPSRGSYSSRGGREYFSSRGRYGPNRGGRESYSSRGNFGSMRGVRESYSRGNYGSNRGGKESYSRGSFGSSRGNRDSFGSSRGNRDSFSRGSFASRGSYGSTRGNRDTFIRGRGSVRGYRGSSNRGLRSDHFGSQFDTQAQLELTKKLVASVLEDSEGGSYRHEKAYRTKEFKQEGKHFYPRESGPYKEHSRSFSQHSSYSHGDKMIKREKSASSSHIDKERYMYSENPKLRMRDKYREAPSKRMHEEDYDDHEDERPPLKHSRLSKRDKFSETRRSSDHGYEERSSSYSPAREESSTRHGSKEIEEEKQPKKVTERKRSERESKSSSSVSEGKKRRSEEEEEVDEEKRNVKVKRKVSVDKDLEEDYNKRRRRKMSPSGMQVTVRSDGERAVNSEGHVKSRISTGKFFVDLQCPRCPGHRSITFKEYRYHLDSRLHQMRMEKLTYKHSIVLRRIRLQQRTELKEAEEKWERENPEEFATTLSRYCNTCKLAFKCLPEDNSTKGIAEHNASKLHKVQERYLFPHCYMCRMSFPSRMIYECHIASIRHLRMKTLCRESGHEGSLESKHLEDDKNRDHEEMDLTNFITMDAVGEDGELEEVGSEHEEIVGKPEDIEKAEEAAKEGEDDDEEEDDEEEAVADPEEKRGRVKSSHLEDDDDLEIELDHEIEEDYDEAEEEEREPCGKDYLVPLDVYLCKLCHKVIRIDTSLGEAALDRHCASSLHIDNFHYLQPEFLVEHGGNFEEQLGEEEQEEHFEDERLVKVEKEVKERDSEEEEEEAEEVDGKLNGK